MDLLAGKPVTKREQREASVGRILDAALRLFVSDGYRHTTVDRIAAGAGLTKGAVYFYFGSKAALLDALLDRVEETVVDNMEARVRAAGPGARARLVAFIHGQAMLGVERWELVLLLILMSLEFHGTGDATERRIAGIYEHLHRRVGEIIGAGKAEGVFRRDRETREQATFVMAGHDGTFLEWYRRGRELDGEELVRALRTGILAGIGTENRKGAKA